MSNTPNPQSEASQELRRQIDILCEDFGIEENEKENWHKATIENFKRRLTALTLNYGREARIDELKKLWKSTQPELVPSGTEPYEIAPTLHERIAALTQQHSDGQEGQDES